MGQFFSISHLDQIVQQIAVSQKHHFENDEKWKHCSTSSARLRIGDDAIIWPLFLPFFPPPMQWMGFSMLKNPNLNTQSCIKGPFCCTFKFENSILAYFDLKLNFFFTFSGDAEIHSFHKQCLHNNSFYHNPLIAGVGI